MSSTVDRERMDYSEQKQGPSFCGRIKHDVEYRAKLLRTARICIVFGMIVSRHACIRDIDTLFIKEHQRLMRVCAYTQTRISLRCWHTQSMDEDEGSYPFRPLAQLDTLAWTFIIIYLARNSEDSYNTG